MPRLLEVCAILNATLYFRAEINDADSLKEEKQTITIVSPSQIDTLVHSTYY